MGTIIFICVPSFACDIHLVEKLSSFWALNKSIIYYMFHIQAIYFSEMGTSLGTIGIF